MAIKAADQITITDITDAYSVILTSEAYTFVGGTGGATSGSKCSTQAVAFCGSNQCNVVNVNKDDIVCPNGVSAIVTNSGTKAVTIEFTLTSTLASAAEATIPVVVDGITVNKKFSFAVAKTGAQGNPGTSVTVTKTEYAYQLSTSGTDIPTGEWQPTPQAPTTTQFAWTRTTTTFSDGKKAVSYTVGGKTGAKGDKGNNGTSPTVTSTKTQYQKSTNGTAVPTGTWSDTALAPDTSNYVWTKTTITYSDGKTAVTYAVAGKTGAKGDTGAAGAPAVTLSVTSSNGTVFKNNSGSTVLSAHVYKAGVEQTIADNGTVANSLGTIKWYKGTTLAATAKTLTVNASDVANVQAYTCQLEN